MSWPWRWPLTYFEVKFVAERGTTILWICLLYQYQPHTIFVLCCSNLFTSHFYDREFITLIRKDLYIYIILFILSKFCVGLHLPNVDATREFNKAMNTSINTLTAKVAQLENSKYDVILPISLYTVDGFIFVGTDFRVLDKNGSFVGFKIRGHSIFFLYSYRKLPFRGYWNSWVRPSTKIGTPRKLSHPQ